tara:strand:- start:2315 stop:2677 length:363 start_codon:yes stop_codon:yes gene_type:complete
MITFVSVKCRAFAYFKSGSFCIRSSCCEFSTNPLSIKKIEKKRRICEHFLIKLLENLWQDWASKNRQYYFVRQKRTNSQEEFLFCSCPFFSSHLSRIVTRNNKLRLFLLFATDFVVEFVV